MRTIWCIKLSPKCGMNLSMVLFTKLYIFQFNITTDNNLILDAEISMLKCGNTGHLMSRATGLIPFSSPNISIKSDLNIIIPNSHYLCGGASWNNENFSTINKSLAKYFCKRGRARTNELQRGLSPRRIPVLVILLHQYQNDGLVYQLFGSSNILLSDLGKMSSIKIDYSKNKLSKIK